MQQIEIIKMTPEAPKKKRSSCACICELFLVLCAVLAGIIAVVGAPPLVSDSEGASLFEGSAAHMKLQKKLSSAQYSVLEGALEEGVLQFVQGWASRQNISVYAMDVHEEYAVVKHWAREARGRLRNIVESPKEGVWIISTLTPPDFSPHPADYTLRRVQAVVEQVRLLYSLHRIVVVSEGKTIRDGLKEGFKSLKFKKIDKKTLVKAIEKHYNVSGEMLLELYPTVQGLLNAIEGGETWRKEYYKEMNLKEISKADRKTLEQLCAEGEAKYNKKQAQLWARVGAVVVGKKVMWANDTVRINYELNSRSNCVNRAAESAEL